MYVKVCGGNEVSECLGRCFIGGHRVPTLQRVYFSIHEIPRAEFCGVCLDGATHEIFCSVRLCRRTSERREGCKVVNIPEQDSNVTRPPKRRTHP
jgi:hypothetical protein